MFCASYQQYRMKGLLVLPVVLILLLGSPAAANLSKGSEAVESRSDATSLKEWGVLAEQGDQVIGNMEQGARPRHEIEGGNQDQEQESANGKIDPAHGREKGRAIGDGIHSVLSSPPPCRAGQRGPGVGAG